MKLKIQLLSALMVSGMGMMSCNKGFENINTNPNTVNQTTPESLLESALYDVVTRNQTRALRITNELMQVHVTTSNSDEIHRYIIRPSESDYMWNNWYVQLLNIRTMYDVAQKLDDPAFKGISRILEAWVYSLLTDTYGDVPYSEALKGYTNSIYQPKFDSQKDIYTDLLVKMEEANTLLQTDKAYNAEIIGRDPIYGKAIVANMATDANAATAASNAFKAAWRKFGNTLYLRLLLRVSSKPETNAVARIKEICDTKKSSYPMFASNAESAVLRFTGIAPFVSAFNTYRDFDFNGDNGLSRFFINTLNDWEDPRRDAWANQAGGVFEGIPSGYLPGAIPERMSTYKVTLKNEPLLGNIINYSELQFMLAEAALKGYTGGDAKTLYENGVTNAITFWNLTVPAGHLQRPGVAWDAAELPEKKLEKIITQKYFTYFFTDFQMWFEYRRTGYPNLPKGPGLSNNGQMPSRLKYPVSVQSLNRTNYEKAAAAMGGDDINSKVWWNK
ncbi:SusD/RagB family nutrient-binding outer membrane lipoprotein [Pseudoflavitalea sp. G-6-1-2]|uniref:SusD/RagB family nutrient-binding outer membrane lipoprotein n=1 Tax=Pseudoflavitalea sp. G-6-1-2 TaxID=2728841 RepID=UPI00146B509C|nr:SusD/RagB family nutrient-binding outer membrane lipoprotein [Pseudoflavitalea sp. G-6-1-2]NML21895.1 SusD/RagB family nutrient-binding outer membrane lipoprotein [Pseudoflavitalea sp. G-6-1-2]